MLPDYWERTLILKSGDWEILWSKNFLSFLLYKTFFRLLYSRIPIFGKSKEDEHWETKNRIF